MTIQQLLQPAGSPFFVIAGPCVIESMEMCMQIAGFMKETCAALGLPYVFKASFDKANRSAGDSFRGPGMEKGLEMLARVKKEYGLPILTDIHEAQQAKAVGQVVDIVQIPAFLARQTDLLQEAGRTGKIINIKKGQFMSPQEMNNALEKVKATGNKELMLTERGTFFGYGRLVNDFGGLAVMKSLGVPVIFDATHSTQQPAGLGAASGGNPELTPPLARAAIAFGVDGLFLECHPNPKQGKSDATSMITLESAKKLLADCVKIRKAM